VYGATGSAAAPAPTGKSVIGTSLTALDIFRRCVERASNLLKIHKAAHGKKSKPEKFLADAHRAAIVLAISALDSYVRTFVTTRIRNVLADRAIPTRLLCLTELRRF
jgi:hypothetical protein